jgi:hypothetical protein
MRSEYLRGLGSAARESGDAQKRRYTDEQRPHLRRVAHVHPHPRRRSHCCSLKASLPSLVGLMGLQCPPPRTCPRAFPLHWPTCFRAPFKRHLEIPVLNPTLVTLVAVGLCKMCGAAAVCKAHTHPSMRCGLFDTKLAQRTLEHRHEERTSGRCPKYNSPNLSSSPAGWISHVSQVPDLENGR